MSKIYRTSRGDAVDMDQLRLSNESTIAIGNARTNARGDQLGPGGKIVKTRSQIMQEYHKLNTPVASEIPVGPESIFEEETPIAENTMLQPTAEDIPVGASVSETPQYVKPRGSFAESVAEQTEVNQDLLEPAAKRNQGISRI